MKGLLRKDLYMLWSNCRSFLLMILVFAGVSLIDSTNAFYTTYPVILGSILPVTLISYEEGCKWNVYCQALPVSRRMVVAEKYLLSLLCGMFILIITGLVQFIVFSREIGFPWHRYWTMMESLFALALLAPSVTLPLIFKLGSEKGRIAYYFVIGGACAIAFLFNDRQFPVIPMSEAALPLITLVIFSLSCLISIRFYEKREL